MIHLPPANYTVSVDGDGARRVDLLEATTAGVYAWFRRADGRPRRATIDPATVDLTGDIGTVELGDDDDPRRITGFRVDPTATGITATVDDSGAVLIVGAR